MHTTTATQLGVEAVAVDDEQNVTITLTQARLERLLVDALKDATRSPRITAHLQAHLMADPRTRTDLTGSPWISLWATSLSMGGADQTVLTPTEALTFSEEITDAAQPLEECLSRGCHNLTAIDGVVCARCEDDYADHYWANR